METASQLPEAFAYVRAFCETHNLCAPGSRIVWHAVYLDALRRNSTGAAAEFAIPDDVLATLERYQHARPGVDAAAAPAPATNTEALLREHNVDVVVRGAHGNKRSADDVELSSLMTEFLLRRASAPATACVVVSGDRDFQFDLVPFYRHMAGRLRIGWIQRPGSPPDTVRRAIADLRAVHTQWPFDSESSRLVLAGPKFAFPSKASPSKSPLENGASGPVATSGMHLCTFFAAGRCNLNLRCRNVHMDPNEARKGRVVDVRDRSRILLVVDRAICWHALRGACSFGHACKKLHPAPACALSAGRLLDVRDAPAGRRGDVHEKPRRIGTRSHDTPVTCASATSPLEPPGRSGPGVDPSRDAGSGGSGVTCTTATPLPLPAPHPVGSLLGDRAAGYGQATWAATVRLEVDAAPTCRDASLWFRTREAAERAQAVLQERRQAQSVEWKDRRGASDEFVCAVPGVNVRAFSYEVVLADVADDVTEETLSQWGAELATFFRVSVARRARHDRSVSEASERSTAASQEVAGLLYYVRTQWPDAVREVERHPPGRSGFHFTVDIHMGDSAAADQAAQRLPEMARSPWVAGLRGATVTSSPRVAVRCVVRHHVTVTLPAPAWALQARPFFEKSLSGWRRDHGLLWRSASAALPRTADTRRVTAVTFAAPSQLGLQQVYRRLQPYVEGAALPQAVATDVVASPRAARFLTALSHDDGSAVFIAHSATDGTVRIYGAPAKVAAARGAVRAFCAALAPRRDQPLRETLVPRPFLQQAND